MNSTKGRIVQKNLSSTPGWNNSWQDFTYFMIELRINKIHFSYEPDD